MTVTMTMRGSFVTCLTLGAVLILQCCSASWFRPPPPHPPTTPRPSKPATYWVTFSTRIRPGLRLPVTVHLLKAGARATVSVTLTNNSDHSVVFAHVLHVPVTGGGNGHTINLEIPRTLEQPHWRHWFQYAIRVVATGDVTFNQSQVVSLDEKAFSIFVQTDKAIYKPGQTVKFRALAMKPDLTTMNEPMDILIRDPDGNAIKRWRNVRGYGNTGVVERSLPTSTDPPLGDWEIDVTVRGQTETKKFTIGKYVLPKFEATLDVSDVFVISEPALRGKVLAKYTFGKPLTGAAVTVTLGFKYFWPRGNVTEKPLLTATGTVNQNGEMEFSFPKDDLMELKRKNNTTHPGQTVRLDWSNVQVIANVTDVRTGRKMSAVSDVRFVGDPVKIEFLPLTANNYKPGLQYSAYVKVTQADGTLFPNYQEISVVFNVTTLVPDVKPRRLPNILEAIPSAAGAAKSIMIRPPHPPPFYTPDRTVVLLTEIKRLTANGFLAVDVDIPAEAKSITVKVETMGVSKLRTASKAVSGSGHFLQIIGQKQSPKVGQVAKLGVRTTERVNKVIYQVYTKGVMISESEASASDGSGQKFTISFPVTTNMAPNCKVLAFYLRPSDGEVVADTLSFKVDLSSADQVQVSYGRGKVKPGEAVQMTVTARPHSVVFLLAVDKSVQLLKSGNDITQEMVSEELAGYNFGGGFHGYWRYMFICGWPFPSQGQDAFSIFRDANVAMLTDGDVYRQPFIPYYRGPLYMAASGVSAFADSSVGNGLKAAPAPPPEAAADRVRTLFPETWLWDMVLTGPSGRVVRKTVVPDTITTWLTSAFAVHPQHGLSVIQEPAKVVTFKEVFLSLDLPYSAIRGEDLCMKAFAFNYYSQSLNMLMVMGATPGIDNIRVHRGVRRVSGTVYRGLGTVAVNEVKDTLYCFTPTGLGHFPLRVNLTGGQGVQHFTDAVERSLLVEPEGTPRVTNIPVILDVEPRVVFEHDVNILFPTDTVPGSERITVSLAGDLLGPVFENIDDLLRMPYGCGEQNMLYFAPNVFLIDYMQRTNTYTPERAEKAERYMLIGYQKEIRYQHNDGSYSAFGNRKKNETGSMWLTAFVVKCFAQSMALRGEVVTIEPKIMKRSVLWMISRQHKNGSFPEPGKVFSKRMQGGSATGEALTAYVIIALAETEENFKDLAGEDLVKLQGSLSRGRTYLEQRLPYLTDPYDLAIVTYALHLTNSTQAKHAFTLLAAKAVRESLTVYWERPKPPTPSRYSWQRKTDAINIEMTSYALLTYMVRGDVAGALPIVRWLTMQRGPQGGFISTQDTVTALQALSLVATEIYQPSFSPITVTVLWRVGGAVHSISLTMDNSTRGLLQSAAIPIHNNEIPPSLTIQARTPHADTASGNAVAEVTLNYNVLADTNQFPFVLTWHVRPVDDSRFVLEVEGKRVDGQEGSMTVIDVGLLTGYHVDEDSALFHTATATNTEFKGRHYILYFDQIDGKGVRVVLPMVISNGIPVNTEAGVIRIYDYYENDQEQAVKYSLGKKNFCSAQPIYEGCAFSRGRERFAEFRRSRSRF
ncbi:LOW QUALITY PROTEIN: CD109 antigen-like [Babylonia areolata]|uniref:LOW QUALITY PROTEIN: CD109 antigen-like n=1 Tax=Babylonia areolata TaxID=304850 RepID=UPI003FD2B767